MERATITQLKNGLSAYVDRVKAGETVLVTDRGIPVAVLEPVTTQVDWRDRLARLERDGLVRRGRQSRMPRELIHTPGPPVTGTGRTLADLVIDERRSGR